MANKHFLYHTGIDRKEDFIEADQKPSGKWDYGFEWMEVGDQLRCPIMCDESPQDALSRVTSAAIGWKVKNLAEERKHIKWRSEARNKYILIERAE